MRRLMLVRALLVTGIVAGLGFISLQRACGIDLPRAHLPTPVSGQPVVALPAADGDLGVDLAATLRQRRSARSFDRAQPVTLDQVARLMWSAQGVSSPRGLRTAPSAGGLYPMTAYLVAARVASLPAGVYRYQPGDHHLVTLGTGDVMPGLAAVSYGGQSWIAGAAAAVVVVGETAVSAAKYGERAERYVQIEAGHIGQNVQLTATALGLRCGLVGAFDDPSMARLLLLPDGCRSYLLLPVGR